LSFKGAAPAPVVEVTVTVFDFEALPEPVGPVEAPAACTKYSHEIPFGSST